MTSTHQCPQNVDSAYPPPPLLNSPVRGVTSLVALGIVSYSAPTVPSLAVPTLAPAPTSVRLCLLTISKLNLHNVPTQLWNAESSRMTPVSKSRCITA